MIHQKIMRTAEFIAGATRPDIAEIRRAYSVEGASEYELSLSVQEARTEWRKRLFAAQGLRLAVNDVVDVVLGDILTGGHTTTRPEYIDESQSTHSLHQWDLQTQRHEL
jgi:hypothetical protein